MVEMCSNLNPIALTLAPTAWEISRNEVGLCNDELLTVWTANHFAEAGPSLIYPL